MNPQINTFNQTEPETECGVGACSGFLRNDYHLDEY